MFRLIGLEKRRYLAKQSRRLQSELSTVTTFHGARASMKRNNHCSGSQQLCFANVCKVSFPLNYKLAIEKSQSQRKSCECASSRSFCYKVKTGPHMSVRPGILVNSQYYLTTVRSFYLSDQRIPNSSLFTAEKIARTDALVILELTPTP